MKSKAMPPEIRAIFDKRETAGLRFSILVIIAVILFFIPGELSATSGSVETPLVLGSFALYLVILIAMYAVLRHSRYLSRVGWVMTGLMLFYLVAMPVIWYYSVGWTAVPASYLLKTVFAQLCLLLIAIISLPGQPLYPLTVTIGSIALMAVHLALALGDPRSRFTSAYLDAVFGAPALDGFIIVNFLFVAVAGGVLTIAAGRSRRTVLEAVELLARNGRLSRYFSPNVAARMASADSSFFKPGGRVHDVAVLFSDIRSFTSLSESMAPDEVLALLSDYQRRMTAAIFAQGGTLDKFIGDGIMATFGTPDPAPDSARRALLAGVGMMRALVSYNEERAAEGKPLIRHGIGIHYGPALVGNVGTPERLEFTVIGDTVNAASRIEDACKEYGRDFLVSRQVLDAAGADMESEVIGSIEVKGKKQHLDVVAPKY
jgi:Adenylate cyclase, family 3 (some proteins contain HAMP domain)